MKEGQRERENDTMEIRSMGQEIFLKVILIGSEKVVSAKTRCKFYN